MMSSLSISRIKTESRFVQWVLIGVALLYLFLLLFLPIILILVSALKKGFPMYVQALQDPETWVAIKLSLFVAVVAVPLNVIFGLFAAWAITKYSFRGKSLLLALIDLPLSVSPVISGMIFVLLFGANGFLGEFLAAHGIRVIFAVPGIILATVFVTFPYVAREVIPVMKAQGKDEEEAAMTLGANGFQIFTKVTLPNIKWGLFYGVILCNARALGEFGAVSVVSGHIRGVTTTLPLHVEILYNEYAFAAAFSVASLFIGLALFTLLLKHIVGFRLKREGLK